MLTGGSSCEQLSQTISRIMSVRSEKDDVVGHVLDAMVGAAMQRSPASTPRGSTLSGYSTASDYFVSDAEDPRGADHVGMADVYAVGV